MGSSKKIVDFFDNSTELNFEEAKAFLLELVQDKLPSFKLVKNYHDLRGYWGFFFENNDNITVFLGSERTFIDYFLKIDNDKIGLNDIDKRLLKLKNTSKGNFDFLIDVIKNHLINIGRV